jgi:hypothetical protein
MMVQELGSVEYDNELNTIICKYIKNVRQSDGSEHEPSTVKGIVASIDRHLRSNNYGNSMKKGDAFSLQKPWI